MTTLLRGLVHWQRSGAYLRLGIEHILFGVDHLLFVFDLLLIVGVEIGQIFFAGMIVALERCVSYPGNPVAEAHRGAARLYRGVAGRLLDHSTHCFAVWGTAMKRFHFSSLPAGEALLALTVLPASAMPAFAHVQQGQAQGFLTGLSHPISGLDHVLAMIAVGLWGAQLGPPAVWLLPVTFPMMMAFGGFFGLIGIPLPGIEVGIALSAVLLGLMVAREAKPPLIVAGAIVAFFAVFHGHAHGTELPPGQSALLYSIGFVIATGCLHCIGVAIGVVHKWPAGRFALRFSGAVVALAGAGFLWSAFP